MEGVGIDMPSGKGPEMVGPVSADRVDSLHIAGQGPIQRCLVRAASGTLCYPL